MSHPPFPIILSFVSSSLDVILYLFFDCVCLCVEAMRFGSLFLFLFVVILHGKNFVILFHDFLIL